MMKKTMVVSGLVLALLGCLISYQVGRHAVRQHDSGSELAADSESGKNDKTPLNLICDLKVSMPVKDLDSPRQAFTQMVIAGIDFSNLSGWYQGQFTISETRKGTLSTEGSVLHVRRPAMFQRFGVMVTGEEFTLNRATGEFRQSLNLQDGRTLELMSGYCGKFAKAPF